MLREAPKWDNSLERTETDDVSDIRGVCLALTST